MAERADSLVIGIEVDLANARREYEAFKREVETGTLRTGGGAAGGSTTVGRSFTGLEGAIGTTAGVGATSVAAMSAVGRAVGGTGFSAPTMPVGTAYLNGVYGNVKEHLISQASSRIGSLPGIDPAPFVGPGAMPGRLPTTNGYRSYFGRALNSGIRSPFSEEEYNAPGGWQSALYEMDAWREQRQSNRLGRRTPRSAPPGGGSAVPTSPPAARARGFGGIGVENVTRAAAVGAVALNIADDFVSSGQRQSDIQRFDTLDEAADDAFETQKSVRGIRRTIGGLLNRAGRSTVGRIAAAAAGLGGLVEYGRQTDGFVDDDSIRSARDNALRQRGNRLTTASRANAADTLAENALIGSSGFGLEVGTARESQRRRNLSLDQQANANPFADLSAERAAGNAGTARQYADIGTRIAQAVTAAFGGARATGFAGSNNPFAAGLAGIDALAQARRFDLERAVQGLNPGAASMLRAADDATYQSERSAFTMGYNRQAGIATNALLSSVAVSRLSRRGDSFGAEIASLRAENQATLDGLPGYELYKQNPNLVGDSDRNRINATIAAGQERIAAASQARAGEVNGRKFDLASGRATLGFDPFGAARANINASFTRNYTGKDISQEDVAFGESQRNQAIAIVDQQQNLQRIDTRRSLNTESGVLDRLRKRDVVGARALDIAGSGVSRLQGLARNGTDSDLVEQARQNTLKQLDLTEESYRLSFRGRQVALQTVTPDFRRDGQNPAEVFQTINEARSQVKGADPNEGRSSGSATTTKIDEQSQRSQARYIADEIVKLLAK